MSKIPPKRRGWGRDGVPVIEDDQRVAGVYFGKRFSFSNEPPRAKNINRAPVTDPNNRLLGIVTRTDIVRSSCSLKI